MSAVTSLQFTDTFVVTSSDDGTVKLWDLKTGDFIRNLVELPSGGSGEWEGLGVWSLVWSVWCGVLYGNWSLKTKHAAIVNRYTPAGIKFSKR